MHVGEERAFEEDATELDLSAELEETDSRDARSRGGSRAGSRVVEDIRGDRLTRQAERKSGKPSNLAARSQPNLRREDPVRDLRRDPGGAVVDAVDVAVVRAGREPADLS